MLNNALVWLWTLFKSLGSLKQVSMKAVLKTGYIPNKSEDLVQWEWMEMLYKWFKIWQKNCIFSKSFLPNKFIWTNLYLHNFCQFLNKKLYHPHRWVFRRRFFRWILAHPWKPIWLHKLGDWLHHWVNKASWTLQY